MKSAALVKCFLEYRSKTKPIKEDQRKTRTATLFGKDEIKVSPRKGIRLPDIGWVDCDFDMTDKEYRTVDWIAIIQDDNEQFHVVFGTEDPFDGNNSLPKVEGIVDAVPYKFYEDFMLNSENKGN